MFSEDGQICDKTWTLYPPQPITHQLYRCDSKFHVDQLYGYYDVGDKYLILLIRGQDTTFLEYERQKELNLEHINKIGRYGARIARNHDQGGQSQNRIERLRQIQIQEYLKGVNEKAISLALKEDDLTQTKYKGLILAGSGQKKDELLKGPLDARLVNIYLGTITCDTEIDLEAVNNIIDGIHSGELKRRWSDFQDMVRLEPDRLTFGQRETMCALNDALLKEIYVKKSTEDLLTLCQSVGCSIVEVGHYAMEYDGLCGVKWY